MKFEIEILAPPAQLATVLEECNLIQNHKPNLTDLSTAFLQLHCVKFLVEERGASVNQQEVGSGRTPLHRCARMAHYTHRPYLDIFEYLLQQGADPSLNSAVRFSVQALPQ